MICNVDWMVVIFMMTLSLRLSEKKTCLLFPLELGALSVSSIGLDLHSVGQVVASGSNGGSGTFCSSQKCFDGFDISTAQISS